MATTATMVTTTTMATMVVTTMVVTTMVVTTTAMVTTMMMGGWGGMTNASFFAATVSSLLEASSYSLLNTCPPKLVREEVEGRKEGIKEEE